MVGQSRVSSKKHKIILLGSTDGSCLTTVRALAGEKDSDLILANFEKPTVADYSRFLIGVIYLPDPHSDLLACAERLLQEIVGRQADLVFPINDQALEIIDFVRDRIPSICAVAAPVPTIRKAAQSKVGIIRIAEQLGIQYPPSFLLSDDVVDMQTEELLAKGVYAKPEYSCQARNGFLESFYVKRLKSKAELEEFWSDHKWRVRVLLQQQVDGIGLGLNIFAIEGKLVAFSINRRIHEPRGGGPGSFRSTGDIDERSIKIAEGIANATRWTGPMMIEVKKSGEVYYLLELNTRLWGSLRLSEASGISYPVLTKRHFLREPLPEFDSRPAVARHFLRDVKWALANGKPKEVIGVLSAPVRVALGKEVFDVETAEDPLPGLMQLPLMFRKKVLERVQRRLARFGGKLRARVLSRISREKRVAFVCHGNINRSAFAQYYLKARYGIDSFSFATTNVSDRMASLFCRRIALRDYGIDISGHRSKSLIHHKSKWAQLAEIVVFDGLLAMEVRALLGHDVNVCMLDVNEIVDPDGKPEGEYVECFRLIAGRIDEIASMSALTALEEDPAKECG
jgi:protein-tyrosine-phosphatase